MNNPLHPYRFHKPRSCETGARISLPGTRCSRVLGAFILLVVACLIPLQLFSYDPDSSGTRIRSTRSLTIFPAGLWEGTIQLPVRGGSDTGSELSRSTSPLSLRILPDGKTAFVDMPSQGMFRFPVTDLVLGESRISFRLASGTTRSLLRFEGFPSRQPAGSSAALPEKNAIQGQRSGSVSGSGSAFPDAGPTVPVNPLRKTSSTLMVGAFSGGDLAGTFRLELRTETRVPNEEILLVEGFSGPLPGVITYPPDAMAPVPLVILVGAAGATDRDGNNFNVPGRNNAYKMLAGELALQGVATFRFDKRGTGEAVTLVHDESFLRFYQYVDDAAEIMNSLRRDDRFSRIIIFGHAEGSLVAAAAINRSRIPVDTFIAACADPRDPVTTVRAGFGNLSPGELAEAESILSNLASGWMVEEMSLVFKDFFRAEYQPYLASWFAYSLSAEIPALEMPVLFIQGGRDLHSPPDIVEELLKLRPASTCYIIPTMNRMLKDVPADENANYRSITDPSFPLAKGLADLLSALAKLDPVPSWIPRAR